MTSSVANIEWMRCRIFLRDADQRGACSPPKREPERAKHSERQQRDAAPVRHPKSPDDARAVLAQGKEFCGFGRRLRPNKGASDRRCCAGGKVLERPPVDELAEAPHWPGPMPAVQIRAGPAAALRVWLLLIGILAELAAAPALPLNWIYPILPGARGRNGQIEGGLNVGIFGTDVYAALLLHGG